MSAETAWCRAAAQERQPTCNRLIRLPYSEQIGMAAELAIAIIEGTASRRVTWNSFTGEVTWLWPRGGRHGDWWMLPIRTMRLAETISQHAGGSLAIMRRIARRALVQREWHRKNGGPPSGGYGKYYTAKMQAAAQKLVLRRPQKLSQRCPRADGYMPAYVGHGMWRVAVLDRHQNTIRMIGRYDQEDEAYACAKRCSEALWRLTHRGDRERLWEPDDIPVWRRRV